MLRGAIFRRDDMLERSVESSITLDRGCNDRTAQKRVMDWSQVNESVWRTSCYQQYIRFPYSIE
ncbi:hypothetical protein WM25_32905 [Burkholderia ubonensis]|nr:hypothetical protein WM25_32905 [Burkholderia ubonensis]